MPRAVRQVCQERKRQGAGCQPSASRPPAVRQEPSHSPSGGESVDGDARSSWWFPGCGTPAQPRGLWWLSHLLMEGARGSLGTVQLQGSWVLGGRAKLPCLSTIWGIVPLSSTQDSCPVMLCCPLSQPWPRARCCPQGKGEAPERVCARTCVSASVCTCARVCLRLCVHVCACTCVSECVCTCVHIRMSVHVLVHTYVCERVCPHQWVQKRLGEQWVPGCTWFEGDKLCVS